MIYDLSHSIKENLPVYPRDPLVKIVQAGMLEKDGWNDKVLTMGTHNGTHMDAPAHMISGGKQLKDYPADRFIVKAICVDARAGFDAASLSGLINEPGMGAIFYTGTSERFNEESYWHEYPVLNDSTIKTLIENKVSIVGLDTGSFDSNENFPVHKALLGADILLIENLTNLEPLVGKTFELLALPLKLEDDGAPARVIARI